MNEGHAGFLGLERISALIADDGLTFTEALCTVRAGTVFTTHTPVPAGIDRFPMDLVHHYLDPDDDGRCRLLPGLTPGEVLALGAEDDPTRFNMAHMGLRLAQRANGVAQLHGQVSREMFAPLYPGFEPDEVPIGSVTNGVHLPTWAAREMYDVAGDMADWQDLASASEWPAAYRVSSERLWDLQTEAARPAGRDGQGGDPGVLAAAGRRRARARVDREDPGPGHPDHRIRPAGVDLQAAHPDAA